MKKPASRSALALLLLFTLCETGRAVLIEVSAPVTTVNRGDLIAIQLDLSGWDSSDPEVDSIDFPVSFDQTVFQFGSGTALTTGAGTFITDNQQAGAILNDASDATNTAFGIWRFVVQDDDVFPSSFQGAGVNVTGGALGSLTLMVRNNAPLGNTIISTSSATFLSPFGGVISPTGGVTHGSATLTVVPEPSAFLYFGLVAAIGGGGVWCARQRRGGTNAS